MKRHETRNNIAQAGSWAAIPDRQLWIRAERYGWRKGRRHHEHQPGQAGVASRLCTAGRPQTTAIPRFKLRRMAGSGAELPVFSFSFWLRRADANGGVPNAANAPVVPLD